MPPASLFSLPKRFCSSSSAMRSMSQRAPSLSARRCAPPSSAGFSSARASRSAPLLVQAIHDAADDFRPRAHRGAILVLVAEHARPVAVRHLAHAGAHAHALRPRGQHLLDQPLDLLRRKGFERRGPRAVLPLRRAHLRVVKIADAVGLAPELAAHALKHAAQRFAAPLRRLDALLQGVDLLLLPAAVRPAYGSCRLQGSLHSACSLLFVFARPRRRRVRMNAVFYTARGFTRSPSGPSVSSFVAISV